MSVRIRSSLLLTGVLLVGCERPAAPEFVSSARVAELSPELQESLRAELTKEAGTYARPLIVGQVESPDQSHGQAVYQQQCAQCHGVSGDGNGPAAAYLYPRPRDYRKGLFKFTSTPYGARPLRSDLVRTVRVGVKGTSMPAFHLLPESDVTAVVDYVLTLTKRGEFEEALTNQAEAEEELDPELIRDETLPLVTDRWKPGATMLVSPLTPQPQFTEAHVKAGREAFLTIGCAKCHGEDGRGQMPENIGKDVWGWTTRAADLTSGMFHGGREPIDIYRRIYSGINGTPMPGFSSVLSSQPETAWNLVAYVLHVSNRRREGEPPLPGAIKPYVPESERVDAAAVAAGE